MKIAIPSDDQVTLCPHFGRTRGFLIFSIKNGIVENQEYRANTFTQHVMGQQQPQHHHEHEHQGERHQHSHGGILEALKDCEVVIAGGMGYRLQEDLARAEKQVFITRLSDAREAVERFLKDNLESDKDACCHH